MLGEERDGELEGKPEARTRTRFSRKPAKEGAGRVRAPAVVADEAEITADEAQQDEAAKEEEKPNEDAGERRWSAAASTEATVENCRRRQCGTGRRRRRGRRRRGEEGRPHGPAQA